MLLLDVASPLLSRAPELGSSKVTSRFISHGWVDGTKGSTTEAPDRSYWTHYDYYMMERDARARRPAQIYSMIATWGIQLWQRVGVLSHAMVHAI